MNDQVFVKAPAKLNLFLRVLDKKENGFHNIRTGITFLDLHDEINISLSNKHNLKYSGPFKPSTKKFNNDIIVKVMKHFSILKKIKINVEIKKNIPWQAGLGSASTDAASFIRGLEKMKLIKNIDNNFLLQIGSDVPACYYRKNCFVTGVGQEVNKNIYFSKYFFVLIKPPIKLSTAMMYKKIKQYNYIDNDYIKQTRSLKSIHNNDNKNDFEEIIKKENKNISKILNFLSQLDKNEFVRMTGSGSCCYAAFNKKNHAKHAFDLTLEKFKDCWVYLTENNTIGK